MKRLKKMLSVFMAISVLFCSFVFSSDVFATTIPNISLDVIYTAQISGSDDNIWYTFTPQVSGTYSFVSYTVGKTRAFLYTRTTNPDGSRTYNGIGAAPASDPDYMNEDVRTFEYQGATYTHTSTAFRLICHLEAGTQYYFSAGWASDTTSSGTIRVRLKLDSIDQDAKIIESISAVTSAQLDRNYDGSWVKDAYGDRYFLYNIDRAIANMTITINYSDGSTSSGVGQYNIDGYNVSYAHSQNTTHWYEQSSPLYTKNVITVTVGEHQCECEVPVRIVESSYNLRGKVVDYITGRPIENARIYTGNILLGQTNSDGVFNSYYPYGEYYVTIEAENCITREAYLWIYKSGSNDRSEDPIKIIQGDYNEDGLINGKDFGYIQKMLTGDEKEYQKTKFPNQFMYTANNYDDLIIG